jgi:hypothetical protein
MGTKVTVFLLACTVVNLFAFTNIAQREEQNALLYYILETVVKPSMIGVYEEALKDYMAILTKQKSLYSRYVFSSTEDYHYFSIVPLKNYGDFEALRKSNLDIFNKIGNEKMSELDTCFTSACEYTNRSFIRHMPEFSYSPGNPRLKPEEATYICCRYCYIKPGKAIEFETVASEWVLLYKSKDFPDGYDLFVCDIGNDLPLYFWIGRARDVVDSLGQSVREQKIFGKKPMELMRKTMATLRKSELKRCLFRPDLSHIVKEK